MTDTAPEPRRRSTWKIVGIVAAAVVGILLVAVFWVRSVTEARWERFREEMKGRAARERARDPRRPVLRGTGEPGNAWDDYAIAIAELKKVPDRIKLNDLVQRTPKGDPASGAAMVEQSPAVLDPLRRGASRSTARIDFEWDKGFSMPVPGLSEGSQIVNLAVLKARSLLEAGKSREAAGLLLDAAQFGRDRADDGPMITEMIGVAMLSTALEGLRELSASEKADAESLADMDQGLAVLEGSLPKHAACVRREQLGMGMTFVGEGASTLLPGASGMLPLKILFLDAFGRLQEAFDQYAKVSEGSWADCVAEGKRIDAEIQKSWNPLLKIVVPAQTSSERAMRERLAQLRLLRAGLRYRRTGELLDLDDPFGTKLRSAKSGDGMKFWSVGADGIDNGGVGEYRPRSGADIVLEARR
ncbi:MAG TPA: hypothetical protein VM222_05445 [Planctomycetota bacterium]|nr:hypothetical protein [Planctomycetota bacterium]